MDVRRADLHTHTFYSDGKLSPAALVKKVFEHGIRALAITDHDAIDALVEAAPAAERLGVELIAGVELSVTIDGGEIHLLGYGFDPLHRDLNEHLRAFRTVRTDRAAEMLRLLDALGLPLTIEDVLAHAEAGVVGRPHVAQALVAAGLVASYEDAFSLYLKDHGPAFVPKPLFPAREAIAMVHDAGGIASLAHPGTRTDGRTIKRLIDVGMDGLETIHPSHGPGLTRRYEDMARKYGLIETGGSDYHGVRADEDHNLFRYSISYRRFETIRRSAA
jgi:hypothetical protein